MKQALRRGRYVFFFALLDTFPLSFYGRSLSERFENFWKSLRACVSPLLNVATITILIITITIVAGLYSGTVKWMRDYVENNQMARTVEISSTFSTQVGVYTQETLDDLQVLDADGATIEAVHGWNDVTFWFYDASGSKDDTLTHGRTVDPQDPLLDELDFLGPETRSDQIFQDQGIAQAIVSLALLSSLGYERSGPYPSEIHLDYQGSKAAVAVVGVCAQTPAGDFLLTEQFNRDLLDRRWNPNPRFASVYLGPVADPQAAESALEQVASYLGGPRISVTAEVVRRAGTEQWLLFQREGSAWNHRQWEELFLPTLRRRLGSVASRWQHEFPDALAPELASHRSLESVFTRASIYVKKLEGVPRVADALIEQGYQVTSNSRELALLFLQISSLGSGILAAVILVVGTLTAVSIGLSFTQTIQRKTPEIAILKAFGTGNGTVLAVYLIEAAVLWAISLVLGAAVVSRAAAVVNDQMVSLLRLQGFLDFGESGSRIIDLSQGILLSVAGGSLLLCFLATVLASLVAVKLQPAAALNLQR